MTLPHSFYLYNGTVRFMRSVGMTMERVKTGMPGLDGLMEGGIPSGFNVLVVGAPGTGKTIMGLQYLCGGAKEGDIGMYVTLDSRADQVIEQGKQFDWGLERFMAEGKVRMLEIPLNKQKRVDIFKMIEDKAKEWKVKRIVFDSLSSFIFNINQFIISLPKIDDMSKMQEDLKKYIGEDPVTKQMIPEALQKDMPDPKFYQTGSANTEKRVVYLTLRELAKIGTTNIIITGQAQTLDSASVDGVSEFVADGVILLDVQEIAKKAVRSLQIKKLRNTKQELDKFRLEFSKSGLEVNEEKIYIGSKISGISQ